MNTIQISTLGYRTLWLREPRGIGLWFMDVFSIRTDGTTHVERIQFSGLYTDALRAARRWARATNGYKIEILP